jgi:hypothetical protein
MAVNVHIGGVEAQTGALEGRVCRPVVADLHNFDKGQKTKWNTVILTVLLVLIMITGSGSYRGSVSGILSILNPAWKKSDQG